jgi:threonine aldolase
LLVEPPQTNILFVNLVGEARARSAELIPYLATRGVLATGLYQLRFVTHLDVDAAGIDQTVAALRDFLAA